jgi:hypothetical protein
MPDPKAVLTWLMLPSLFAAGWICAGFDLMTGART